MRMTGRLKNEDCSLTLCFNMFQSLHGNRRSTAVVASILPAPPPPPPLTFSSSHSPLYGRRKKSLSPCTTDTDHCVGSVTGRSFTVAKNITCQHRDVVEALTC